MTLKPPPHRSPLRVDRSAGTLVNDLHSRLNATRVRRVLRPRTRAELAGIVARCADEGRPLAVCGGRGAMGGQAFAGGERLVDTRGLDRVLDLDPERGIVRVEAGIRWRALVRATARLAARGGPRWAIAQKQTGGDGMTLGGSVSANAHGRGLRLPPLVDQVEALELLDDDGRARRVSRSEGPERFRLAVGGYGLFGVVTAVELRLVPWHKVRRRVEVRTSEGLMEAFAERIAEGFEFGDFQPALDPRRPDFLRRGVFACYEPVPDDTPLAAPRQLAPDDWRTLLRLAHTDPHRAFQAYAAHYLASDGQVYGSDAHQLATYVRGYHKGVDACLGTRGSEMITELYAPRHRFEAFLEDVRATLLERRAQPVYGTVRLIERDDESFLAWAREPWACLVLNLHVDHDPAGIARAGADFRALIDVALAHGGSFFLTYHRFATAAQLRAAHPRLDEFLAQKQALDPEGRFTSDWHRHLARTLA